MYGTYAYVADDSFVRVVTCSGGAWYGVEVGCSVCTCDGVGGADSGLGGCTYSGGTT